MPIKPEHRKFYGPAHERRARNAKEATGWLCQDCGARHGTLIERPDGSYYRVTLTLAHLNHCPWDNDPENLRVLCAPCHLRHDRPHHVEESAKTRNRKTAEAQQRAGQLRLV